MWTRVCSLLILSVSCTTSYNKKNAECGDGWHMSPSDDSCYKFVTDEFGMKWLEARRACRLLGSRLVTIDTREEYDFLIEMVVNLTQGSIGGGFGFDNLYTQIDDYVHIGLTKDYTQRLGIFKDMFVWEDGSPLMFRDWGKTFGTHISQPNGAHQETCTAMLRQEGWHDIGCGDPVGTGYICEKKIGNVTEANDAPVLPRDDNFGLNSSLYLRCGNDEIVSVLRRCDGGEDCLDGTDERNCETSCSEHQYQCGNGRCIHISFYCDYIDDCGDNSDETHCVPEPCSKGWSCHNGQCIARERRCDSIQHCVDGSDELECDTCNAFDCFDGRCIPNFWKNDGIVDCNGMKKEDENCPPQKPPLLNLRVPSRQYPVTVLGETPLSCLRIPDIFGKVSSSFQWYNIQNCSNIECPVGFYKCPSAYCIPAYLVCNGIQDCPRGEDETNCDTFHCPGYYRCQKFGSGMSHCIHQNELCDSIIHCPGGDDERHCNLTCPMGCSCYGQSVVCSNKTIPDIQSFPKTARRIEISDVNISNVELKFEGFYFLETLKIFDCSMNYVPNITGCPNLLSLDLSSNNIADIPAGTFKDLRLEKLDLSGNEDLTIDASGSFKGLGSLIKLFLSKTQNEHLEPGALQGMPKLEYLSFFDSSLETIEEGAFSGLGHLKTLDISETEIDIFSKDMFSGLDTLQTLHSESPALCCDGIRPKSVSKEKCFSEDDKISTCADLMGTETLRIFIWILGIMAVVGNCSVLGFRLVYDRAVLRKGYGIFITNLCIADLIMGIYLIIIAGTDLAYRGRYVWHAIWWRHSFLCQFGGFLSTVSSEASCLFICFITLDRFLVVKFPFGQVRFSMRISIIVSVMAWLLAITYSAIPFLRIFKSWDFYTQNSVCLPLPFEDEQSTGWYYSFSVFVCFNCVAFMFIAFGQILIYREISSSGIKDQKRPAQELAIAKRLFLIVFTDFCCWFPVGVFGIMAATGTDLPDTVFAWAAVFILPVNSALNPMLYTLPFITQMKKSKSSRYSSQPLKEKSSLTSVPSTSVSSAGKVTNSMFPTKTNGSLPVVEASKPVVYIGRPRDDMERLKEVVRANRITSLALYDVIGQILDLLHYKVTNGEVTWTFIEDDLFLKIDSSTDKVDEVCLSREADTKEKLAYTTHM